MSQYLFKGGRVFDATSTEITAHKAVLVEEGQITAYESAEHFAGFQGEVIDTHNATLMPGLIDSHVHICFSASFDPRGDMAKRDNAKITLHALQHAQATLEGGVTAIRDCGGKDYIEFAVRDLIKQGVFAGPTIKAAGRMICMTGGHGNFIGRIADGQEDVIRAVREQIHAGCDLVKIMATGGVMTPGVNPEDAHYSVEELTAGVSEAHRFSKRAASHAQGTQGILNAVRAGIDSIEHGIFMSEEAIAEMIAAGTYLVPTLAAIRNILENADGGIPEYVVEKSRGVVERHIQSIRDYYHAGGKIAMGTDAGTPCNVHGLNALELAYMVDVGVSEADALRISTTNAADLLGLDDVGTIEVGKRADLLLVRGNPLDQINQVAEKTNHLLVMKNGELVTGQHASRATA